MRHLVEVVLSPFFAQSCHPFFQFVDLRAQHDGLELLYLWVHRDHLLSLTSAGLLILLTLLRDSEQIVSTREA